MQYGKHLTSFSYFVTYLGEWNNSKVWESSKAFVSIARGYCAIANLSLALKLDRPIIFHSLDTMSLLYERKNTSYLPCVVCQTRELNVPYKLFTLFNKKIEAKIYLCEESSSFSPARLVINIVKLEEAWISTIYTIADIMSLYTVPGIATTKMISSHFSRCKL